ncbi:MAG: hypothetical protein ACRDY0_06310 [Acidimicrobiales bacterium]
MIALALPGQVRSVRAGSVSVPRRAASGVRSITATVTSSPRRAVQVSLGLLWLLDAGLQFQHYMFTPSFVTGTLLPTARGNPEVVAGPLKWVDHGILHHLLAYNLAFASLQALIAVGLWLRPTVKVALVSSVAWGLMVWWFGEGLGGVLGGASPLSGAPGAVVLYVLVAVLAWPGGREAGGSVATSGPLGRVVPCLAWAGLWESFTYLLLLPANRAPGALSAMLAGEAAGEPGWVASLDHDLARLLAGHGATVSAVLALACALVAVSVLSPVLVRPGLVAAGVVAAAIWVGEDFGTIFTGSGTDPNSGPILALLAATFWPLRKGAPTREDGAPR